MVEPVSTSSTFSSGKRSATRCAKRQPVRRRDGERCRRCLLEGKKAMPGAPDAHGSAARNGTDALQDRVHAFPFGCKAIAEFTGHRDGKLLITRQTGAQVVQFVREPLGMLPEGKRHGPRDAAGVSRLEDFAPPISRPRMAHGGGVGRDLGRGVRRDREGSIFMGGSDAQTTLYRLKRR